MSTTTKSPKKLAAAAYHILRSTLPEHSSRYSPKKFTQPQLMVCLVLKTFFNADYRGIVQILDDCPNLCKVFELKTVPHFTTLQKATRRLMKYNIAKDLLVATIRKVMGKRKIVPLAAVDATGFENGHISPYFFKHSSRSRKQHKSSKFTKWPKMAVLADTDNHLILAIAEDRGPGRDATHFEKLLLRIPKSITVKALVADAGYDSEKSHELARETYGIDSIISPKSGPKAITNKLPKGKYRRQMKTRFDKKRYGQRWQVETVDSMIKRNLTDCINSKSYWAQYREMLLLAITHNLLIVLLVK